jgi:Ca2+-binding EF-hand superfamily protein
MCDSQQQQQAVQFTDEEIQNLKEIFDLFDKE